jgi:hypothetical protein
LLVLGRYREALQQVKTIASNDPLSPEAARIAAVVLEAMGQFDEAADQCLKMGDGDPIKVWALSRARLGQGRTAPIRPDERRMLSIGLPEGPLFPGLVPEKA